MTTILILVALLASGLDQPRELTIDDLAKGLRAREGAFRTFTFRGDFVRTQRSEFTGLMLKSAASCQFRLDRLTGHFRYDSVGQKYVPPGPAKGGQEHFLGYAEVSVFDGRETRSLETITVTGEDGKPHESTPNGRIAAGSRPSWVVDPDDILHDGKVRAVGRILETLPTEILGPGESPGPGIVVVECLGRSTSEGDDPCDNRSRYWIDVAKNFVVVREILSFRRKGQSRWITMSDSVSEDWLQIQDGIWVPRKYREETNQMFPGKEPYLEYATEGTLKDWAINTPLDDGAIRLVFPKGTTVNDSIRGTVYDAGAIDDRSIAGAVRTASELRTSYMGTKAGLGEVGRASGRGLLVPGLACGVVLVVAVLFLAKRARTRAASKGRES